MRRPPLPTVAAAVLLGACTADRMDDRRAMRGIENAEASVGPRPPESIDSRNATPALIAGDQRVSWEHLLPMLAEAGGAAVINEVVLDSALESECRRRGIQVGASEIEAERSRFASSLAMGGLDADPDRLVESFRRERGLGPVRYESMLRRTAMLRALVRDRVVVNDAATDRAYRLRYGPRYDIRVIVTRTARECEQALEASGDQASFMEQAMSVSVDPSGASGGLLRSISVDDLAWPQALRSLLPEMAPGEIRGPIAVEDGWAILRLERVVPAPPDAPDRATVRENMALMARLSQERVLMEAESRRLVSGQDVWLDPRLRWSWGPGAGSGR